ncbi:hypothetical protein BH23ACT5_BH23ACT5_22360 [soil metagenome]
MTVCLATVSCGVLDELNPRMHFGTRPELPAGVKVAQDFERGGDGFALDIPEAFERFNACFDDVRVSLADSGQLRMSETERELYAMLCSEAAGNGWVPGNRRDEALLLNELAIKATRCVRDRGWDFPDPVPERHGRFLEIADPQAPDVVPDDEGAAMALLRDVDECNDEHAIDWSDWVIENLRN